MRRSPLAAIFAALAALLLAPAFAQADGRTMLRPGALCQPHEGSRDKVDYDERGVFNVSNTPATITCPLPSWSRDEPMTSIAVTLVDGGAQAKIECTARATNHEGTTQWSNRQFSPGVGFGTMAFAPAAVRLFWIWTLQCTLPAQQSGNFSRLMMVKVDTSF